MLCQAEYIKEGGQCKRTSPLFFRNKRFCDARIPKDMLRREHTKYIDV